jgi:hypothetical protein
MSRLTARFGAKLVRATQNRCNRAGEPANLSFSSVILARFGVSMLRKILIMGLPGAGKKTTLANALAPLLNAVVFNADSNASVLGFSCLVQSH